MRTTALIVSLALLGLAAAAPTASAAQVGKPVIAPGPCSYEGDSLQAQVLDATYSVKCTGVDLALFAAGYGVDVANAAIDLAETYIDTLADPVIVFVNAVCEMTLENCNLEFQVTDLTDDVTLAPPPIDMADASDLLEASVN